MPKDSRYFLNPSAEGRFLSRADILQVNQNFLKLLNRLDRLERVAVRKPPGVNGLTAQGRQGAFHITWKKIIGVDGYVLVMASDTAAQQITHRWEITGHETVAWTVPWANVASLRYFQIWSVRAGLHSIPSTIVSATSVAFGAGETAPTAPVQYSRNPEFEGSDLGIIGGTRLA